MFGCILIVSVWSPIVFICSTVVFDFTLSRNFKLGQKFIWVFCFSSIDETISWPVRYWYVSSTSGSSEKITGAVLPRIYYAFEIQIFC